MKAANGGPSLKPATGNPSKPGAASAAAGSPLPAATRKSPAADSGRSQLKKSSAAPTPRGEPSPGAPEQPAPSGVNGKRPTLPAIVYDQTGGDYWRQTPKWVFVRASEKDLRRHLRILGWDPDRPTDTFNVDKFDALVVRIQDEGSVDAVARLSGHRAGVWTTPDGRRILVDRAARLIRPESGPTPNFDAFLGEMLGEVQTSFLLGWWSCALVDFYSQNPARWRHSQMLALVGPPKCGKSFLQKLISATLGGREADPYLWMAGHSTFNAEISEAAHLCMEDKAAFRDSKSRSSFAAAIKGLTVSSRLAAHAKGKQAMAVDCFRRLSISANEDAEYVTVLPPLDESILDKVLLLRCAPAKMLPDFGENWSRFERELGAWVGRLLAYEIPFDQRCERMGVTTYHDPEILQLLADFEPDRKLLELVDKVIFRDAPGSLLAAAPERFTASEIQARLFGDATFGGLARQTLPHSNVVGTLLRRLAKSHPRRVRVAVVNGATSYYLHAPQAEEIPCST